MTSEPGLLSGIYARGPVAGQLTEAAWLQAMLDVEAALARACAAEGMIGSDAAERIVMACRADALDAAARAELNRATAANATPVVGLVAWLRGVVGEQVAAAVHLGATSQDIVDTALMLVARRALRPLLDDARGVGDAAAALAGAHRGTPMIGRTLLMQALPTTFGLRAAGWLDGVDHAARILTEVRRRDLAVQMGGPVGGRPPAIAARVADTLGLATPVLSWQPIRIRPVALATALGMLSGILGKIARDVTLLSADEVGECREGGDDRGASSAMAHKRNPVAAVSVLACTKRTPGLVAGALACMEQEHERAAGAWQAEWGIHAELLTLAGSAAAWARDLLEGLEVDAPRMAANLAASAVAGAPLPDGASALIDRALEAHAR